MDCLLKKQETGARAVLVTAAGIGAFALMTFLAALVRIPLPFSPVPLTLQTFVVLLSGVMLGGAAGALSQLLYLALGLAGFSVFSGTGSGILYLCGPTGGYIPGFVLASLFCGCMLPKARNYAGSWFILFAGSMIILACGTAWLKCVTGVSWGTAAALGAAPFIPGDLLKVSAAAFAVCRFRTLSL